MPHPVPAMGGWSDSQKVPIAVADEHSDKSRGLPLLLHSERGTTMKHSPHAPPLSHLVTFMSGQVIDIHEPGEGVAILITWCAASGQEIRIYVRVAGVV